MRSALSQDKLFTLAIVTLLVVFGVVAEQCRWGLDLLQYRGAAQIFSRGENPYDYSLILAHAQAALNVQETGPIHQSPQTLYLLSLFFASTGEYWRIGAAVIQVLLAAALILMVSELRGSRGKSLMPGVFVVVTFLPFIEVTVFGQLSLLAVTALVATLYALSQKRCFLAGVLFAFCMMKPHVIALAIAFVFVSLLRSRAVRFFLGFVPSVALVTFLGAASNPVAFGGFFEMPYSPLEWSSTSLITPLRLVAVFLTGTDPAWVAWTPLLVAMFCTVLYAFLRQPRGEITLQDIIPLILFSLIVMPYGFIFDQVTAVTVPLALLFSERFRSKGILASYALLLSLFWISVTLGWEDWRACWFPPALLALWYVSREGRGAYARVAPGL